MRNIYLSFVCRMPFLQPSPESALTRATPVLGYTHSFTHTLTHSLRPIYFVQFTYTACLWIVGETGAPGGNPRRHGENMQTPHRKAYWLSQDSNQGPSCCEPLCRPYIRNIKIPNLLQLSNLKVTTWENSFSVSVVVSFGLSIWG